MRILFASPHCALDRSSGAAISVTTQLEELAALGWQCSTLSGTVTDRQERIDEHYQEWGIRRVGWVADSLLLGTQRQGVEHCIVPMRDTRRSQISSGDEQRYFNVLRQQLRSQRPDVLYLYGKRLLEQAMVREAGRQGIPTAFYLANASYRDTDPFEQVAAIFTPSQALADFYHQQLGLHAHTIGSFTRPLQLPAGERQAVLFVNPELGKGVAFLFAIAQSCLSELPEARFLVVESRGNQQASARALGIDWAQTPNVTFLPQQADLSAAFAQARLLLFPALSFDAAPRVIVEALHAGIPVLGSRQGGVAEMLGNGGELIEIPPAYACEPATIPATEILKPWVTSLQRLWHDEAWYAAQSTRAKTAAQAHDLPELARKLSQRLANLAATGSA